MIEQTVNERYKPTLSLFLARSLLLSPGEDPTVFSKQVKL